MTIAFGWDVLLPLLLLGGVVAVDGTSFGQFMVSRPFVAASIAGWIVGSPLQGAAIGVVLEVFHIAVLPVGAAKYPEGGPPAVAGGAIYGLATPSPGTLLLLVLFVLLMEWVSGESVRLIRTANVRIVAPHADRLRSASHVERMHLVAIGLDFFRGMLLVAIGVLVLVAVTRTLLPYWGLDEALGSVIVTAIVAGLLAGSLRVAGSQIWLAAAGAAGAFLVLAL